MVVGRMVVGITTSYTITYHH